jgi:SAM-dependent methyltransferase
VLDVGCGTGKQLAADRDVLPEALLVGVDPFANMLRVAHERCPAVAWVRADGTELPFADEAFDHVTNQFSYQHVAGRERLFAEIRRVVRPGGRFVLTNIDPWLMDDWIIYRYFPAARERDRADFLPIDALVDVLQEAGFTRIRYDRRVERSDEDLSEAVAYCEARHRTSQLMVIKDRDYEAGLDRLRRDAAGGGTAPTELCWLTVVAAR